MCVCVCVLPAELVQAELPSELVQQQDIAIEEVVLVSLHHFGGRDRFLDVVTIVLTINKYSVSN